MFLIQPILSIIAGKDPNDNYTSAQPFDTVPDYTQALNFSNLRGARIGIPRNRLWPIITSQPMFAAFEAAIETIKAAGAIIVDNTNFSAWDELVANDNFDVSSETIILNADFLVILATYMSELTHNPNNIHDLQNVSNFIHNFPLEDYPARDTAAWDQALELDYVNTDSIFGKHIKIPLTGAAQEA